VYKQQIFAASKDMLDARKEKWFTRTGKKQKKENAYLTTARGRRGATAYEDGKKRAIRRAMGRSKKEKDTEKASICLRGGCGHGCAGGSKKKQRAEKKERILYVHCQVKEGKDCPKSARQKNLAEIVRGGEGKEPADSVQIYCLDKTEEKKKKEGGKGGQRDMNLEGKVSLPQ